MPNFNYKARDRAGRPITGQMEAENTRKVSETLAKQGYIPISVSQVNASADLLGNIFKPKVKLADRTIFTRQLCTMVKAGLPLLSSLTSLRDQVQSPYFKKILVQIIKELEGGAPFSESLAHHPDVFDSLYVNMIRSGESSGKIDLILTNLAEMGDFDIQTKDRVKEATRYPLITVLALIVAFFIVITFVIPKFASVYGQMGSALPLPTRILLWINDTIRNDWPKVLILLGAVTYAFHWYTHTPGGRYRWDLFRIKVPVFGALVMGLTMSRFTKILSELMSSGVPIIQSLQLVGDTVDNTVIRKAIHSIQQSVNEGKGMAEPMRRSGFFTPMVLQMVTIGEQTGKSDELLKHVSGYYQEQADHMTKNLTTLIEPMLIFMIGGMVVVLALGVFLPMWNMTQVVNRH